MCLEYDLVPDYEFDALHITLPEAENAPGIHRYPAKFHAKRVARLLKASEGIIYLRGTRSGTYPYSDQSVPHRQSRYFYYLTGVDEPDFEVTYDIGADRLVLWIPLPRSPRDALYNGEVPSVQDCIKRYDVDDARYAPELPAFLEVRPVTIYALHPAEVPALALAQPLNPLHALCQPIPAPGTHSHSASVNDGLTFLMGGGVLPQLPSLSLSSSLPSSPSSQATPSIDTTSLLPAIDAARIVKTPHEIAMIRRACAISCRAHRAVAAQLRQMYTEENAEATFSSTCTNLGARTQAYPIIAGSGANAARLHYDKNSAPLLQSQFMVLDAGCEWKCYASDITRTLPIGGRWRSAEARAVHNLVAEMQDAVLDMVRPGAHWLDFVDKAHDLGLLGLHKLGLLKGDLFELLTSGRGIMSAFLPHGLGHPVGLEVHDFSMAYHTPSKSAISKSAVVDEIPFSDADARRHRAATLSMSESLESSDDLFDRSAWLLMREGMVVAIEPGLYFNREYIEAFLHTHKKLAHYVDHAVLDRFWQVGGCRIEDVVLVTSGGREVLSAAAPKGRELWDVIGGDLRG